MSEAIPDPWNAGFRRGSNELTNPGLWIHPPGAKELDHGDEGIALILIAESTSHVINMAVHPGGSGDGDSEMPRWPRSIAIRIANPEGPVP